MGLEAVAPKPDLSKPANGHRVYPYLLRGVQIEAPGHVWSTDITLHRHGQRVPVSHRRDGLAQPLRALGRSATPWTPPSVWKLCMVRCCNILHQRSSTTDQGSQYTSDLFTGALLQEGIKVSMDGKGRATDNAFIERLWRSVKQQCVYRHSPADGNELRSLLAEYFAYYNHQRPHQHLDGLTPAHLYFGLPDTRNRTLTPNLVEPQFTLTTA
ncbi:MAG: transposase [Flavobacteriales bacterium]|nr:transposase [Flavobacteriales bacterium]